MSLDMVDDLHEAEDRIGVLEAAILAIVAEALVLPGGPLSQAIYRARGQVGNLYCRVSCQIEKGEDDFDLDHHLDDDCCGCPCHNREEPT